MRKILIPCLYFVIIMSVFACNSQDEKDSILNKKSGTHQSLLLALQEENYSSIKSIIANSDISRLFGEYSIEYFTNALNCKSETCIEILLENGLDPNTFDISMKRNMIFNALGIEKLKHLKALIAHNADVNVKDGANQTPLIYSIALGYYSTAILLLEHGADPNIKDSFDENALDVFIYTTPSDESFQDADFRKLRKMLEQKVN